MDKTDPAWWGVAAASDVLWTTLFGPQTRPIDRLVQIRAALQAAYDAGVARERAELADRLQLSREHDRQGWAAYNALNEWGAKMLIERERWHKALLSIATNCCDSCQCQEAAQSALRAPSAPSEGGS